ncbi:MAG TPA: methyltransferase domain-containing protein [Hyphomicrobiaceae bacterium]|jgi:SAM-dependent methyltransferase
MPPPNAPVRREPSWSEQGSAAVDLGDLGAAKECFAQAVRTDRSNAGHRYRLAVVEEALGELGAAGASLTQALRLDPGMADAARRLSLLAGRCDLPAGVPLSPAGLRAALAHDTADRELIAEMALRQLAGDGGPLAGPLARGREEGWLAAARSLCLARTAPLLKDELFTAVLCTSIFRGPDIERLLTALRSVLLLEMPPQRFREAALFDFTLALAQQCRLNEHVWAVSADEARRVEKLDPSADAVLRGDATAGRDFLLAALYLPLRALLPEQLRPEQASRIRPRAVREVVVGYLAEAASERAHRARLPRLGAIADATARTVAEQYEASPYPRWTSVGVIAPRAMRRALGRFFRADELAFLDRPFDVLVAGCGTGQQAVQAALAYGPQARVLAVDLSAASLAYAARMAERYGAGNIAFAQADLHTLPETGAGLAGRFQVIECTGVLHHLADPFRGWRALLACLAEDGRMFLGLYSATARQGLAALRRDPAWPGPGCSDAALRAFRQVLLDRPAGAPGGDLKMSRDFYSTSNFRDLALHVRECPVTLKEIAQFLRDNTLAFRGFQISGSVFDLLREEFPSEDWPGALERWAEFETANPLTFSGMYNFWCTRCRG